MPAPDKKLSNNDIVFLAGQYTIDPLLLEAFIKTSFSGDGFLDDGRPGIVFHRHLFWKYLSPFYRSVYNRRKFKALAVKNPDILHKEPDKQLPTNLIAEHDKLNKALKINKEAAILSASWGKFALAGENFKAAGFSTVDDFVSAHEKNEQEHLKAFLRYLGSIRFEDNNLLRLFNEQNLEQFVSGFPISANQQKPDIQKIETVFKKMREDTDNPVVLPPPYLARLTRTSATTKQTLGDLIVYKDGAEIFTCKTLELPWKNNERNSSCIPVGSYNAVKRFSPKYKNHFHLTNVPGRSMILIHIGNFYTQTEGCILVGTGHADIDADGHLDVVQSGVAMNKLNELLPDEFEVVVEQKV